MQARAILRPPPALLDPAVTRIFGLVAVVGGLLVGMAAGLGISQNLLLIGVLSPFVLILIYARPHWAVAIYVVLVYADLLSILVKYHDFPPLARFAGAIMLSAVLGYRLVYRREPLRADQVTPWLLAYGFVVALGLFYAKDPSGVMTEVVEFVRNFLTYLVIVNALTTTKRLKLALWLLLAMGTLLALLSIYQSVTGNTDNDFGGLAQFRVSEITSDTDAARPGGTIGDANFYGQLLLIVVPIGFYFAFTARHFIAKAFGLFCTLVLIGGVVFTYSRGDAVALGALLLAALVYKRPKLPFLLGLLLFGVVALQFLPPNYTSRLSTITDVITGNQQTLLTEQSIRGRAGAVQAAIAMFGDHPILGVGRENYPLYEVQYLEGSSIALHSVGIPPHDLYLEIATEDGLVGLIVFGGLIFVVVGAIVEARRRFLQQKARADAELAMWFGIGLFGYMVSCLFLHGAFLYMLWLQIALIVALRQISRRAEPESVALPPAPETVAPMLPFADTTAPRRFLSPVGSNAYTRRLPTFGGRNGKGAPADSQIVVEARSPQPVTLASEESIVSPNPAVQVPAPSILDVENLFHRFWLDNGGEALFGNAISPVLEEVQPSGELACVHYYEYARLEYSRIGPNLQQGVALGKLGLEVPVEGRPATLPPGLAGQAVRLRPGSTASPAVPPLFADVWELTGGEAVNGYPVAPVRQVLTTGGLSLFVQLFERSRFEYHPEHAGTSYEVQRTPLGSVLYSMRYAEAPGRAH